MKTLWEYPIILRMYRGPEEKHLRTATVSIFALHFEPQEGFPVPKGFQKLYVLLLQIIFRSGSQVAKYRVYYCITCIVTALC